MIDTFALIVSHGMLVIVVLRLFKVTDPAMPSKKEKRAAVAARLGPRPRA